MPKTMNFRQVRVPLTSQTPCSVHPREARWNLPRAALRPETPLALSREQNRENTASSESPQTLAPGAVPPGRAPPHLLPRTYGLCESSLPFTSAPKASVINQKQMSSNGLLPNVTLWTLFFGLQLKPNFLIFGKFRKLIFPSHFTLL